MPVVSLRVTIGKGEIAGKIVQHVGVVDVELVEGGLIGVAAHFGLEIRPIDRVGAHFQEHERLGGSRSGQIGRLKKEPKLGCPAPAAVRYPANPPR